MSATAAPRTLVVWCPDWPITAAEIDPDTPAAVFHANRVVACSRGARREGVTRGLRRRDAQARCPELVIVDDDPGRDARAFEPVVSALDDVCPRIEIVRPGLCAFLMRGPSRYFGGDDVVAARTLELAEVDARVGIADGRFAAALAARRAADAPSRWFAVEPGATRTFLGSFPVKVLDRPDLADLLVRLGVRTLGDLAALPPSSVLARFGNDGELAWRLARGMEERPLAARTPPADLSLEAELDPPADRADRAAFVAKSLADQLHDELGRRGLACTRIAIEAETEHGEHHVRLWRHDGALTAGAIAERVRWQLDGWLTSTPGGRDPGGGREQWAKNRPTAGITLVRLTPDEVRPDDGRQLGFWGGTTLQDERAARALARVQGMIGLEGVCTPVVQGGRSPAERARLVPWGDARVAETPGDTPWPGQVPAPAPALVHPAPLAAEVFDRDGAEVRVTGRGLCSAAPAQVSIGGGGWQAITAWAGPWPVDERWWDPPAHRRRARFQLLTDAGAHLAAVEGGRWWIEATYD
ncbi:MAG TPA: DNA polymerase Y family protein [Acidimicrobiales bacterium]|nr:DNA polymerase Y family protein [Acidimicrobiales bacterium]